MRAVVIPVVCLVSMKEEWILIVAILNGILTSLLRLGPSVLLANRSNNGKVKELIM